jgi:hypothetical protein
MRYSGYQRVGFGGFHLTPWVKRLMLVNGAVFLLTMLVGRPLMFDIFAFQPSRVLTRPWGVGTYMFLHYDFWHLFLNMLVLFFFGPPLEDRWGSREFLKFYAICGLGGAALSFLFAGYSIVGASAAVYGIMLAFAMNWPDSPIYIWGIFPVKAKWLGGDRARGRGDAPEGCGGPGPPPGGRGGMVEGRRRRSPRRSRPCPGQDIRRGDGRPHTQ